MEITAVFGSNVFSDKVMKERLPKDAYKALKEAIDKDMPLRPEIAEVVANAMKDWAVEKGATHYTHWFQPLTGITAEKHDSFISPTSKAPGITKIGLQSDSHAFPKKTCHRDKRRDGHESKCINIVTNIFMNT